MELTGTSMPEVKFLHGQYENIATAAENNKQAILIAHDEAVAAFGGNLFYGHPTLEYKNDKIILWGIKGKGEGESATQNRVELGSVDLTLDPFLENAKYFPKEAEFSAIAEWAGEDFDADAVEAEYKEAFNVAVGGKLPEEHSSIVMVMHTEGTEDEHSLVVVPVGNLMGDVQTEVDAIETAVGLESSGTFVNEAEGVSKDAETIKDAIKAIDDNLGVKDADSTLDAETVWGAIEELAAEKSVVVENENNLNITVTSDDADGQVTYTVNETGLTPADGGEVILATNTVAANLSALDEKIGAFSASPEYDESFTAATDNAIETDDTVGEALSKLDNKISALVDEVIANETTTAEAIEDITEAAGLIKNEEGEIGYAPNGDVTYISEAKSLKDADGKLDAALKELADKVGENEVVGLNAIDVTPGVGSKTQVSLTLDPKDATEGSAKVSLSQTENGLRAEVGLDNTAASSKGGGIGLTFDGTVIKATLYWGSFDPQPQA